MGLTGQFSDKFLRCLPDAARKPMGKAGKTVGELTAASDFRREKAIQRDIVTLLEKHRDIVVIRSRTDRRTTNTKGTPDLLFSFRPEGAQEGVPVAWELKTRTGKARPEQEALHARMVRNGWNVFVIRSLEEARETLRLLEAVHHARAFGSG